MLIFKGTWDVFHVRSLSILHFNPRAREGRDTTADMAMAFNDYFNPRAREGRDVDKLWISCG